MLGTYHATFLFEILKEIHFLYEPERLWDYVLKKTCEALQSEAASIYELMPSGKELRVVSAIGVDVERLRHVPFMVGKGVCGWTAERMQPALIPDIRKDPRFNSGADSVTGFQTRSTLCVPIMAKGQPFGVFEIMNRKNGTYSPVDQEFLQLLAQQTAVAYINMKLLGQVSHAHDVLESIFQSLSGGLIVMDGEKNIVAGNKAAGKMLGIHLESLVGHPTHEALKEAPWFSEILHKTLESQNTVSRQEVDLALQGKPAKVGYTTLLIKGRDGRLSGSGVIFQQLSA